MARPDNPSPADPGPHSWFVIANGSRARAYAQRIGGPGYDIIREWDSPEARAHDSALGEDRPGQDLASAGATQRSGIEGEEAAAAATPKGHAQHDLMLTLVEDLTRALRARELSHLYLLAPAPLLHRIKEELPTDLRHAVMGEGTGDFTQRPTVDIFARLDELRRGG